MKKTLVIILMLGVFLLMPMEVSANALSKLPCEETDGIPTEIMQYCEIVGNEFQICPELLESIAYQESRYFVDVENGSCKGVMQINAKLHQDRFTEAGWEYTDWDNAYINIYVAADYIAELFEETEDVAEVLYLYNGDSKNLKRYRESGYLSDYVSDILERSEQLERAHGK